MKRLVKTVAFGLICLGSAGAVSAGSSEECITRKFNDELASVDSRFTTVAAEINAIVDAQPVRPGLHSERARIEGGAEYVRVKVSSTTCANDQSVTPPVTAKCLTLLCETNFPGTSAPLGAEMIIESCASGITTKATYTRVSSGGSLVWRLTDLHESAVGVCPRLKQPGMGGQ